MPDPARIAMIVVGDIDPVLGELLIGIKEELAHVDNVRAARDMLRAEDVPTDRDTLIAYTAQLAAEHECAWPVARIQSSQPQVVLYVWQELGARPPFTSRALHHLGLGSSFNGRPAVIALPAGWGQLRGLLAPASVR